MRLLLIHLKQSSRAPSYAGTIERAVRRWSRREAGEEELSAVVLLGGLEVLRKITVLKGTYNSRLEVVRGFLETVEEAVEEGKRREGEREKRERERKEGKSGLGVGKMVVGSKGRIESVEMGGGRRGSAAPSTATAQGPGQIDGSPESTPDAAAAAGSADEKRLDKGKGKQPATDTSTSSTNETPYLLPNQPLPTDLVTDTVLDQIPLLEDVFLPELRRRIEKEHLLDDAFPDPDEREEELETPYHWVRRVISGKEGGEGGGGAEGAAAAGDDDGAAARARAREIEIGMGAAQEGVAQLGLGQQQTAPRPQGQAGRGEGVLFSSMSRHMLVSVGRDD